MVQTLTRHNMRHTDRSVLVPLKTVAMAPHFGLDLLADRLGIVFSLNFLAVRAKHTCADC